MAAEESRGGLGIGYVLLVGFLAYAAFQFYRVQQKIEQDLSNRGMLRPGVPYYCNRAVSNRPQQVLAFSTRNSDQSTQTGFAPAFGPTENMPSNQCEVFF